MQFKPGGSQLPLVHVQIGEVEQRIGNALTVAQFTLDHQTLLGQPLILSQVV